MMATDEVAKWLQDANLEKYLPALTQHGIVTMADCRRIDEAMMDACGVDLIGHRKRLMKAVSTLKGDGADTTESPPPPLPPRTARSSGARSSTPSTSPTKTSPTPRPRRSPSTQGGAASSGASASSLTSTSGGGGASGGGSGAGSRSGASPVPPPRNRTHRDGGGSTRGGSGARDGAVGKTAAGETQPPALPPRTGRSRPASNASSSVPATTAGATPTWNPLGAKAAVPSPRAIEILKKKGPPRPPLPIYRPVRCEQPSDLASAKIVSVDIGEEEEDGKQGYFTVPVSKHKSRSSSSTSETQADGAPARLPTYMGKSKEVSKRTKQGFLSKRGGPTGRKGWDKRWFDLSDGELKYFRDKEKKPAGVIPVSQMVDVRYTASGKSDKHAFRFELDTPDRTFYLSAETSGEMTEWMMLLAALIQADKDGGEAVGGDMSNPDKAGWLKIRTNDLFPKWVRHYLVIKGDTLCLYTSYDDFTKVKPLHSINLLFVKVMSPVLGSQEAKNNQFVLKTNGPEFKCRAESDGEFKSILGAINTGKEYAFSQMNSDRKTDSEKIPSAQALKMMRENANNLLCADCSASKPVWASINFGIMLCDECCGIHRSLGVHITKCRSANLDEWKVALIGVLTGIGNRTANAFWEGKLTDGIKPTHTASMDERGAYIRKKYVDKAWAAFRRPLSEYTVQSMIEGLGGDDVMLTLEHVLAGIDAQHPNASSILEQALERNATVHAELLIQNGFVQAPGSAGAGGGTGRDDDSVVPDDMAREAFELQTQDDSAWTPVWLQYADGMLSLYPSADATHPNESVPAGALKMVVPGFGGSHFVLTLATPVVHGSTRLALRPQQGTARVEQWVACLAAVLSELPSHVQFDFGGCTKVGSLIQLREGGVRLRPRWFALRDGQLRYFSSKDNPNELGCIDCRTLRHISPSVVTGGGGSAGPSLSTIPPSPGAFSLVADDAVLVLDAGTEAEMRSWVQALRDTRVFGATIDSHATTVPPVVDQCCSFLERRDKATLEQLYALPGDDARVDALKHAFNRNGDGRDPPLTSQAHAFTVHDVANLLQLYFMELPTPLLPAALLDGLSGVVGHLHVDEVDTSVALPPDVVTTVMTLPASNRDTLGRLCHHVQLIAEACPVYGAQGASTLDRLACVFGPLLFGLDDHDDEGLLSVADCSVKLLFTHPSLSVGD
eukprot:m.8540 g.8540  ORF g.8540 m.8540 type:complete len:1181 (+) comp2549_c0_seq2:251-3793(+)